MMKTATFFDKNKRDLRSKSNYGDDSRPRESSLGDFIANAINADACTESLKSEAV